MKRIILATFIVLVIGVVLAIKYLPWWAILGLVVALAIAGKFTVKKLLRKAILIPFKLKGAPLHAATVEIQSLVPVQAPTAVDNTEESDSEGSSTAGRNFYELDLTIKPVEQANSPFQGWEPGELRLVRPESRLNPESDEADDNDDSCNVTRLELWQDSAFVVDEGWKVQGPQRLKLVLAIKPGTTRLKFRYYFEEFGQLIIPDNSAVQAA